MKKSMTRGLLAIPTLALIASCASQKKVEISPNHDPAYIRGADPAGLKGRTISTDEINQKAQSILLSSKFIELNSTKEFTKNEVLTDRQFQIRIRKVSQMEGADLMSAPSVVTTSGTTATSEIIREYPISNGKTKEVVNLGVTLAITAHPLKNGRIHLSGKSTVRELDSVEKEFGDNSAVTVLSTDTYFDMILKDGRTAQLVCNNKGATGQRIVFITPQLIDPSGRPVRE